MGAVQAKKLLAVALLAIVALSGFLAGHQYANSQALTNTMHVELYVYKDGKLVYYDPDDPATRQFLGAIAELLLAQNIAGAVRDTGGTPRNYIGTGDSGNAGYVFLNYDQAYNYVYTMYQLPSNYQANMVTDYAFDDANKAFQLSASITVNNTGTVYGVGLYSHLRLGVAEANAVFFYDPLENPLNVTAGDVITIVYKIVVP